MDEWSGGRMRCSVVANGTCFSPETVLIVSNKRMLPTRTLFEQGYVMLMPHGGKCCL